MSERRVDTIVRGGVVVTGSGTYEADVAIEGERIVAVGPAEALPQAERTIDATGKYVFPGAIDCHVHLNLEGWRLGSSMAARAGVTTIVPFVSYRAAEQETLPAAIERISDEVAGQLSTDVSLNFILLNTPYVLESLPQAIAMGAMAHKVFMTYKRGPLMSPDEQILGAMEAIAGAGGLLQLHCENGEVLDYLHERAVAEGRTRPVDYPATCPPAAEAEAINRAIHMAEVTGCPIYVVHLSTRQGLERIREAQASGLPVWTETCPQYLLLGEEEMERLGPYAKIGPPLRARDEGHQDAMWEGVAGGTISTIGSDHAPAARERKEPGRENVFFAADGGAIPFGAPSLETLVPLVFSEGVAGRGLPPWWMARVLSENPARLFGLYPRKGVIQPGSDADLLIVDPQAEWTISADDHLGLAGYTPYEGWTVRGRPWMTMLRGRVLLHDGRLEQEPGIGQVVPAGALVPPLGGAVAAPGGVAEEGVAWRTS
jgi:dihydropyrimidinase